MSNEKPATPSIAKKICKIMEECENLEKKGYNKFHDYWYVREAEAVNGIRRLLGKHGLAIIPHVMKETLTSVPSKSGQQNLTRTEINYHLICSETGEERVVPWVGFGQDTGEKGFYKALTGSHKYFLMKVFNVSAGDEHSDPENEGGGGDRRDNRHQQNQQRGNHQQKGQQNQQRPPAKGQPQQQQRPPAQKPQNPVDPLATLRARLFAEGAQLGYTDPLIKELTKKEFPAVKSRADLTKLQIETLLQIMRTKPRPKVGSDEDIAAAAMEPPEPYDDETRT